MKQQKVNFRIDPRNSKKWRGRWTRKSRLGLGSLSARPALLAIAVGLSITSMAGCGKHHLTEEQKATVKETLASTGRTTNAVPGESGGGSDHAERFSDRVFSRMSAQLGEGQSPASTPGSKSETADDDSTTAMRARLQQHAAAEECVITATEPSSRGGVSSSFKDDFSVKVDGEKCPVQLAMSSQVNGDVSSSGGTAEIQFDLNYAVKSEDYRKLNDVDAVKMNGKMSISGSSDGVKMSNDMTGTIHSQSKGDLKTKFTASMEASESSMKGEMTVTLEYPQFSAEFKVELDGKDAKFYVNDEEVKEEEFNRYFEKSGAAFEFGASTGSVSVSSGHSM